MEKDKVLEKLNALAQLQHIDSKLDKILTLRGSLPEEVAELEFEIQTKEGSKDRVQGDISDLENEIAKRKANIREFQSQIEKYESQLNSVKNNREYEALNKEIEYARLEILTSDKKIRNFEDQIGQKEMVLADIQTEIDERTHDLEDRKKELEVIVNQTEIEEKRLREESEKAGQLVDVRILNAYRKIRHNMRNGLAVVSTDRDACGGCFAIIPPQLQLEIRQKRKLIICENCGRMLVDRSFFIELEEKDASPV
ncbi:MAG: C4-type zinc ribbon domain-containing protein [Bacteroidota bacterium]